MPPLDFPNSPTGGQTYTGPGGIVWQFDGAKWANGVSAASAATPSDALPAMDGTAAAGTSALYTREGHVHPSDTSRYAASNPSGYQTAAQVTTALTPYAPLASPAFTGAPSLPAGAVAVTAASGDADTSVATTAFVAAATTTALHDVGRNLVHNPLFAIAQRTLPVTATGYTLDRWRAEIVTDTASFSQAALADADRTAIGDEEAISALQNVFTGNAAAGAYDVVQQRIETPRRLSGKTVTVSFWAKAASGTPKLGVSIDQVWNSVATNGTGTAVTLSTTWTRYTASIAVPGGSGKTQVATDYTQLNLWFSSGATNATRAGSVGVQSGTVQIWGVQLEVGPVATILERPDPQQDLAKCQRFYQVGRMQYSGYGAAGAGIVISNLLPVPMRAVATVVPTISGPVNVTGPNMGALNAAAVNLSGTATATGAFALLGDFTASADL